MELLLAGGAVWLLLLLLVISVTRTAARADAASGRRRLAVAATATAAALPAATPAQADAACANAELHLGANPTLAREALLCEIARTRDRRDGGSLEADRRLSLAAERHAEDMVQRRYFSHDSPGGGGLRDRLRRAGYARARCSWRAGEVLAWGTGSRSTARGTVRAWMHSRPHRRILVARKFDEIGLGLRTGTPRDRAEDGVTVVAVLGDRRCSA